MGVVTSKIFRSGNSEAVRLPKEVAFGDNIEVVIERKGDTITIRPARDAADEKRKLEQLIAEMDALPSPATIEKREPLTFRD
jgi:antitoxin VapB